MAELQLLLLIAGLILLVVTITDLLWTTLWVEGGAGPLTGLMLVGGWQTLRWAGRYDSRIRTLAGPLILAGGLLTWVLLLWVGWTLVFASSTNAIIDTLRSNPLSWTDWFYYAGYAIFTLGNGDFAPQDGPWQIITIIATGTGMLLITLSVSYLLNVLSAVTQKRAFASGVTGLGDTGTDVVRTSWNGERFTGLDLPLNTFTSQLNTLTSNHKACPILHYFHSKRAGQSPIVAVVILHEALNFLQYGLASRSHPRATILKNARASVDSYLATLKSAFIEPADQLPPQPDLEALRDHGLPTASEEEFRTALDEQEEQRRTLLGLIESDARDWPTETTE